METILHPVDSWKWFGNAGHFICGHWCRFHICTQVGPWLVSTVGEYVHPRHGGGNEKAERAYLCEHPLGEEIGCGRLFETFVFRAGSPCSSVSCACGLPELVSSELDSLPANDRKTATENHRLLCDRFSRLPATAFDTAEGEQQ